MCSRSSRRNETQMHWEWPKEKEEEKYLPHNVEWICFSLGSIRLTHPFTFVFGVFVVAFAEIILIFSRQQSAEFCDMHENFCRFSICEIAMCGGLSCSRILQIGCKRDERQRKRERARVKYFGYAAFACYARSFTHLFWALFRRDGRRKKIEHRKHNMICMLASLCAVALFHCMFRFNSKPHRFNRWNNSLALPIHNLCSRANIDLQEKKIGSEHNATLLQSSKNNRMQFDIMKKLQCKNFNNAHRIDNDGIKLSLCEIKIRIWLFCALGSKTYGIAKTIEQTNH